MSALGERARVPVMAIRGVVGNRNLRRVQVAFFGAEIGGWIAMIALAVLSYDDAGLAGFGIAFALRMLPPMLTAPFMGVLADRLPRRRVMLASDLVSIVLTAGVAAVVFLGGPLWAVLVLVSLISIAGTAFRPAEAAIMPNLAKTPDELTAANAVSSTIESVGSFLGPAIGGVLVAAIGPGAAFLVTGGTFVWSAALLFGVREPARERDESEGEDAEAHADDWSARKILGELGDGARAVTGNRGLALLIALIGAQVAVDGALLVLLGGLAFEALGTGDTGFGWLLSAMGIGGVVGAVAALGLAGGSLVRGFAFGTALWGAPIALLAVFQTPSTALVLVALVGLANTVVDVASFTLLQRAVPDEVLARVFAILESILYGAVALGALVATPLVALAGLDAALVVTGLFLPVVVVLTWPVLRTLDLEEKPVVVERAGLLRGVPFLATLPPLTIEHLAGALEERRAAAGEVVVEQGTAGEEFYVVSAGELEVSVDGKRVRTEGPGAYFGEIALLRASPRTATVTALRDSTLLTLGRDEFVSAVTGHVEAATAADAVVTARLGAYRPAIMRL